MSTTITKQQFLKLLDQRADEYRTTSRDRLTEHPWYKLAAGWLGVSPWRVIIPVAFATSVFLMLIFRGWAIKGVSWLQWGF